jgi:ferrous iron transport protein A
MRLCDAAVGTDVVVVTVTDDASGRRLTSIGMVPGTQIAVGRRAPLGDPTVYRLRGAEFAIRRDTAQLVEVRPA